MKQDDRLWTCVWKRHRSSVSLVAIVSQDPISSEKHICISKSDGTNHFGYSVCCFLNEQTNGQNNQRISEAETTQGWERDTPPPSLASPLPEVWRSYENLRESTNDVKKQLPFIYVKRFLSILRPKTTYLQCLYFIHQHWNIMLFYANQNTIASSY